MKMLRAAVAVAGMLWLGACTTNPIPQGYSGPVAKVTDSATQRGENSVDVFFLSEIDSKPINQSLLETRGGNYGRGARTVPFIISRDIPATPATVTIMGRTHHAMPMLAFLNTEYEIKGTIKFDPKPNGAYVVKGIMDENYSAVWIEDAQTGAQVGDKVEIHGSAALGFFQK